MDGSKRHRAAFTLVELSVVLVIVGLLVGGVISGQYLVKQAELQSVMTDLSKFKAALVQFRESYAGKPGDLADAIEYWGLDPNGCPTNTVRTPRAETCSGDGDFIIEAVEDFHAWQQLAAAGLIEGVFSGVAGSGGAAHAVAKQNVPASRLTNSGYYLATYTSAAGNANTYDAASSDAVYFGAQTSTGITSGPALTPRQQVQLDSKLDDGKPGTGLLMAYKSPVNPSCSTGDTSAADYLLATQTPACSFLYFMEY